MATTEDLAQPFCFQNHQFASASSALTAYLNQHHGRKWHRKIKHEKQLGDLFLSALKNDKTGGLDSAKLKNAEQKLKSYNGLTKAIEDEYNSALDDLCCRLETDKKRMQEISLGRQKRYHQPELLAVDSLKQGKDSVGTDISDPTVDVQRQSSSSVTQSSQGAEIPQSSHLAQVDKLLASLKESYAKLEKYETLSKEPVTSGTTNVCNSSEKMSRTAVTEQRYSGVGTAQVSRPISHVAYSSATNRLGTNAAYWEVVGSGAVDKSHPPVASRWADGTSTPPVWSSQGFLASPSPVLHQSSPGLSVSGTAASSIVNGHLLKGMSQYATVTNAASTPKQSTDHFHQTLVSANVGRYTSDFDINGFHRSSVPDGFHRSSVPDGFHRSSVPDEFHRSSVPARFAADDLGLSSVSRGRTRIPATNHPRSQSVPSLAQLPYRPTAMPVPQKLTARPTSPDKLSHGVFESIGGCSTNGKQVRYETYLRDLMKDIEETLSQHSRSSTVEEEPLARINEEAAAATSSHEGFEFLARVKSLLSSQPPAVTSSHDTTPDETDSQIKPPRGTVFQTLRWPYDHGDDRVNQKPLKGKDKFIAECLTEAQADAVGSTGLVSEEAAQSDKSSNVSSLSLNDSIAGLLSADTKTLLSKSNRSQPGGVELAKAMRHLSKLKSMITTEPNN